MVENLFQVIEGGLPPRTIEEELESTCHRNERVQLYKFLQKELGEHFPIWNMVLMLDKPSEDEIILNDEYEFEDYIYPANDEDE